MPLSRVRQWSRANSAVLALDWPSARPSSMPTAENSKPTVKESAAARHSPQPRGGLFSSFDQANHPRWVGSGHLAGHSPPSGYRTPNLTTTARPADKYALRQIHPSCRRRAPRIAFSSQGMRPMHRNFIAAASIIVFLFLVAGCGSNRHLPATLKAQSFVPPGNAAPAQTTAGAANSINKPPGTVTADDVQF